MIIANSIKAASHSLPIPVSGDNGLRVSKGGFGKATARSRAPSGTHRSKEVKYENKRIQPQGCSIPRVLACARSLIPGSVSGRARWPSGVLVSGVSVLVAAMQPNCETVDDGAVVPLPYHASRVPVLLARSLLKLSVITVISPINRLARAAPLTPFDPTSFLISSPPIPLQSRANDRPTRS